MNDFERCTAYHEAGHAIIALRQGIVVREVSIIPDATSWGHVTRGPENRNSRVEVEKLIRVSFAGPIAHARFDSFSAVRGDLNDQTRVAELSIGFARRHRVVLDLKQLTAETEAMVDENWPTIEKLAGALVISRCLTFAALQKFITLNLLGA